MSQSYVPASLGRQLLAMFYDSFLLISIWWFVGYVFVVVNGGAVPESPWVRYGLQFPSLVLATWLYYAGSWIRGGQTLGMKAWKLKLVGSDSRALTWADGFKRCALAAVSLFLIGAGYWFALFNSQRETWHDRQTHTRVIRLTS